MPGACCAAEEFAALAELAESIVSCGDLGTICETDGTADAWLTDPNDPRDGCGGDATPLNALCVLASADAGIADCEYNPALP